MQTRNDGVSPEIGELDAAVEAVAAILRAFAHHAFAIDDAEPPQIARAFERWASHVLVHGPLDEDEPRGDGAPAPAPRRRWVDLVRRVKDHRRAEKSFVLRTTSGLREALWIVMSALARGAAEEQESDGGLREKVEALRAAIHHGSVDELRREASTFASTVAHTLDQRSARREEQAKVLRERLQKVEVELDDARRDGATDPLTKLANRRVLDAALERAVSLASLTHRPLSVVFVDVDHFKSVNDRFGHQVGDEVLRRVADCAARCFPRRTDLVARYGGEEIACVLPDTSAGDARMLAERLLRAVRALEIDVGGESLTVTVSAGVAALMDGESAADLLARADRGVYAAKAAGRDRVATDAAEEPVASGRAA